MKVLHIYKTYYPDSFGGVENIIYQIAEGAKEQGVQCDVLTLAHGDGPQELMHGTHRVVRAQADLVIASTGLSFQYFKLFAKMARQADVIHYHYPWPLMDLAHFLIRPKKPSLVTYHLDVTRQRFLMPFYQPLQNLFLSSVDKIVATSPNYLNTSEVLKKYKTKTEVIPLGIDPRNYPEPTPVTLVKWKNALPEKFFLFVGVIRYYKGLHVLLEAAKSVDFPIVIVGSGPDEGEQKEFAHRHNLNNVIFLGSLPEEDKVALLQLCFALVFPSHLRSEAFGVALLEASMYGKPLITAEIGTGTTYVNIHEQTGLVVPPSNVCALVEAMRRLWSNTEWAKRLGEGALARYEALFSGKQMVTSYLALYRRLVS